MKRMLIAAVLSLAAILVLVPRPALADSPLRTPTQIEVVHVSDTSADIWWLRDGSAKEDVVEQRVNGVWREYARNLFGSIHLANLTAGATYTFRIYSVAYPGSGFTDSARTAPITVTTLSGPDTVPPAKPPKPSFLTTTTTFTNVFVSQTTDNVEVTTYYLQQLIGGTWTTIKTIVRGDTMAPTVTGLTANTTYQFAVVAADARGNLSPRSDPGVVTTLANTPNPTCKVQTISYNPGFQVTVTIINTTTATMNGWTLQATAPTTTVLGQSFGGTLARNGTAITITPLVWSATIGQGGQLFVGFSGSATPFVTPSNYTLNGLPCTTV
ncbi:cellulose binding domain-containing protein [Streptosporangiaceae bacterium NEAU-GS5]|nr:cellulose binding domain-containing protein [Streptosporangiaceae bacterium NEAU-GS5]